jgi:hypothetical protein
LKESALAVGASAEATLSAVQRRGSAGMPWYDRRS